MEHYNINLYEAKTNEIYFYTMSKEVLISEIKK